MKVKQDDLDTFMNTSNMSDLFDGEVNNVTAELKFSSFSNNSNKIPAEFEKTNLLNTDLDNKDKKDFDKQKSIHEFSTFNNNENPTGNSLDRKFFSSFIDKKTFSNDQNDIVKKDESKQIQDSQYNKYLASPTFSGEKGTNEFNLDFESLVNFGKNDPAHQIGSTINATEQPDLFMALSQSNLNEQNQITKILVDIAQKTAKIKDNADQKDKEIEILKSQIPTSDVFSNEHANINIENIKKNLVVSDTINENTIKDLEQQITILNEKYKTDEYNYTKKIDELTKENIEITDDLNNYKKKVERLEDEKKELMKDQKLTTKVKMLEETYITQKFNDVEKVFSKKIKIDDKKINDLENKLELVTDEQSILKQDKEVRKNESLGNMELEHANKVTDLQKDHSMEVTKLMDKINTMQDDWKAKKNELNTENEELKTQLYRSEMSQKQVDQIRKENEYQQHQANMKFNNELTVQKSIFIEKVKPSPRRKTLKDVI